MILFLRKIRKSMIENKKARNYIFYALGEVLLVVAGILIALQINNANEIRKGEVKKGEGNKREEEE